MPQTITLREERDRVATGAGAAIPPNGVARGFFDAPAAAYILPDAALSAQADRMTPMRGAFPGRPEQAAAALAWRVSPETSMMTGQTLFVDGGGECPTRRGQSS